MAYRITSQESLLNLAQFYCSKRETSRAWLGRYLQRKCKEQEIEKSVYENWIQSALDACEKSKMVDDQRYAEILIRDYSNRGKGRKYIEQKLKEKGIRKDAQSIPQDETAESERALKLAHKIMAGLKTKVSRKAQRKSALPSKSKYQRPTNEKFELKQKMVQKLITSGFSLDLSRRTVDMVLEN